MAEDSIKLPGTDISVIEKYPPSRRLDFENFGEVCKSTFAKGVITAFHAANEDDPLVIADKCDVEVNGQEYQEVPVFYHPPKAYIENWKLNAESGIHAWGTTPGQEDFWLAAGALDDQKKTINRAGYSFSVGDEVAVMLMEGEPIAVIGFASGKPRRPFDYVQVEMPPQIIDSDYPEDIGDPHCPFILQLSDRNRNSSPSGPSPGEEEPTGESLGPDGFDLKLIKEAKIFPDKVEHQADSGVSEFAIDWNYYCFYEPEVMGPTIQLNGAAWDPPPAPAFGPFYGYMNFGFDSPWADYLAAWINKCNTQQVYGESFVGLWNGQPPFWAITAQDGTIDSFDDIVMRTFLIEAGPKLYFIRCFYRHVKYTYNTNLYLWKNRVIWPWNGIVPPDGWSGFPVGGGSWTAPMWAASPNPTPTSIEECNPQPDDTLALSNVYEAFYANIPHQIFSAPSSRKILDDIDSIVATSNGAVDVVACSGGDLATALPPKGFISETGEYTFPLGQGGIIPSVGNIRELTFKIADKG